MEIYKIEGRHDIEEKKSSLSRYARALHYPLARVTAHRGKRQKRSHYAHARTSPADRDARVYLCLRLYVLRSLTVVVYGVNERNYGADVPYGTL